MSSQVEYVNATLDKGLRVILARRPWSNVADAALSFRTGWRQEDQKTSGLTHLIEHLFMAGDNTRRAEQLGTQGLLVNAVTDWESTTFLASGHASLLEDLFPIYRQILQGLTIDQAQLDRELQVIGHEIANFSEDPTSQLMRHIIADFIDDSDLARSLPSNVDNLRRLTPADVMDHAGKDFHAANGTLVIVSPHDSNTLLESIRNRLDMDSNSPTTKTAREAASPKIQPLKFYFMVGGYGAVVITYVYRPRDLYPLPLMALLTDFLGGGAHGLFLQKLRHETQLAYDTGCNVHALSDCLLLQCHAVVPRRALSQTTHHMINILESLRTDGLSADLFNLAKTRLLRQVDTIEDNSTELCQWLAHESMFSPNQSLITPADFKRQISDFEPDTVNTFLYECLDESLRNVSVIGGALPLARRSIRRTLRAASSRNRDIQPNV